MFLWIVYCNLSFVQLSSRIYPTRVRTTPKKLTLGFGAARSFCEFPEDTQEGIDGSMILERNGETDEENMTSPLYSNGDGSGFSVCNFHTTRRFNLQGNKTGDVSPDGTLEEGEEVPFIRQMMYSTVRLCSCGPNTNSWYAHGTHTFPLLITDSERTERGQKSVVSFNLTRLKIEAQDRSYDQKGFLHNHTCTMSMLNLLVDDVLPSLQSELWRVQDNMEWARKQEKEADNRNVKEGRASFVSFRCTNNAKKDKEEGKEMMIHSAATQYLVALQLVKMAQKCKGENLKEELLEQHNILRQEFVEHKWKDHKGELCQPTSKKMRKCLVMIEEDLNRLVIHKLSDIKIDLEEKMGEIKSLEEESSAADDEYQQLFGLRSTFRNVCIHTAVMLEIGALYLIYMSRGKDAPFYKIDLYRSENQLLQKIEDWECKMCGNALIPEDDMSL